MMSLSDQVRGGSEAAPWVVDEIAKLEAERDRLREVIDRAAKAWMFLEPQVAWEGDLADAMAAGVAEIERLTAELAKVRAEHDAQMRRLVGWLSADITALHRVEVPLLAASLNRFLIADATDALAAQEKRDE